MKITMLGMQESGKTAYMATMAQLFLYSDQNGFKLSDINKNTNINHFGAVYRRFSEIDTIIKEFEFPDATSQSTYLNLELQYIGNNVKESIIPIEWVDYRGGILNNIVSNKEIRTDTERSEIEKVLQTLVLSDVIMVFVDGVIITDYPNNLVARDRAGINTISSILSALLNIKRDLNILFLITKADSDLIGENKYKDLVKRCKELYSGLIREIKSSRSVYNFIPVGCVGFNKVKTTKQQVNKALRKYSVDIVTNDPTPINIAESFAYCLHQACLLAKNNCIEKVENDMIELEKSKNNFGTIKNIFDILINDSQRREKIFNLEESIEMKKNEAIKLEQYLNPLGEIWKGKVG